MQEIINQEEEKKLIQREYRKLLRSIKSDMDDTDRKNIRMAYEIAVEAHSKQRRKSGEPYILHPIEVARICAEEIGLGPTAIVAALLHDVVEDTNVTLKQIRDWFGDRIAMIVDGLTKLDGLYNVASPQAENFKKVLKTLIEDVRVVLIKMADRLHNMRTLGSMPRHKQLKIAAETTFIYAPLAHRLGLYSFKSEFQDLAMKITESEKYLEIEQKLQDTKRERSRYIRQFIKPLKKALKDIGYPVRTEGSPKSIYTIWNKIKTRKVPFEEIYELFSIRIIIDVPINQEKQACWEVYSIISDVYTPVPKKLKDWITTPKSNGYESLHTTLIGPKGRFVEVQIRSERMNEIAEKGFAAHWKYKAVSDQPDVYQSWFDNVREILSDNENDAVEFLNEFKSNLFSEEVFVYTPRGELKILPKGATAIDFAFSIHTDIGFHCSGVKINNKLMPVGYQLKNGDQIRILTNPGQKPKEEWLKLVITSKARSAIRRYFKEEKEKAVLMGRKILKERLEVEDLTEEMIWQLARHNAFNTNEEFLYTISLDMTGIRFFDKPAKDSESPKSNTMHYALTINNHPPEFYDYSLANCCKPGYEDKVFGYLTSGDKIKVHKFSCPNAANLTKNYGYRILNAEWILTSKKEVTVRILIEGIDEGPGFIERLSHFISVDLALNIKSFSIDGKNGRFEGQISIAVKSDQVQQLVDQLNAFDGIEQATIIDH